MAHSCLTLCDPVDCSTPGFPIHHQHLELAQTHVHQVSDAIQPLLPLSSHSPPTFNVSQHQGLFQGVSPLRVGQSIGAWASVLSMNIQDWFLLGMTGLIFLQSKGLSRVFSNIQFKSINSSVLSFLNGPTPTSIHNYRKNIALTKWTIKLVRKWKSFMIASSQDSHLNILCSASKYYFTCLKSHWIHDHIWLFFFFLI